MPGMPHLMAARNLFRAATSFLSAHNRPLRRLLNPLFCKRFRQFRQAKEEAESWLARQRRS